MKKNSSEKLLARYQQGSDTASVNASFEIHARYQNRLIGLSKKRLMGVLSAKIDADDIAQETFAAFFAMADRDEIRWRQRGDLWRLLAGIAINKIKQQFEHYSTQKRNLQSESHLNSSEQLPANKIGDGYVNELAELVENVLVSEKPLVGEILKLRLAGFSFEEISTRVGRSTRTVARLLENLKAKLIIDQEIESWPRRTGTSPAIERPAELDYNDFHLLRMIGQGSFAKVYLAKQISSGHFFALKVIKRKWLDNVEVRQSFQREARLLMSLSDPSLVQTFGTGLLPNGGCFLVLELIEGKPLARLVETASLEDRVAWSEQLRNAIDRLHAANLVHGDICANNVMIDRDGQVKLLDFGLGSLGAGRKVGFRFDLEALERLCKLLLHNYSTSNVISAEKTP